MKTVPRPTLHRLRGFTLVELLIAIAVAGVLLTLAAPSFRDFILMQRLKGINAQVVTDMQFARSEAASRGLMVNVRVQPDNGTLSCYILFTDRNWSYPDGPSNRCDCTRAEANRCTIAGTTEIRTVRVPRTDKVFLSPVGPAQNFAFDPVSGGILMQVSESGMLMGDAFTILASIDGARSLGTTVGLSGRPSVCRPAGSTLNEPPCP